MFVRTPILILTITITITLTITITISRFCRALPPFAVFVLANPANAALDDTCRALPRRWLNAMYQIAIAFAASSPPANPCFS